MALVSGDALPRDFGKSSILFAEDHAGSGKIGCGFRRSQIRAAQRPAAIAPAARGRAFAGRPAARSYGMLRIISGDMGIMFALR
ncbi:hypothetical protein [Rhizobium sp. SYY.PMSO]|uniref:hypothetical protein n=1 Tax=Rhizobium sp. SYY.PMSO TaxID=3382192 RepID=UPI0013B04A4C